MSRVAVIGAGAVGCYYGARLAQARHEVRFLMRRDYDAVARSGLDVRSKDGDFRLDAPLVHRRSDEIGPVDWIVCALKSTAIEDARALIKPCVGEDTRILLLMNGLGLEERFADWFGAARIFGGLAFTCINRDTPGLVHHIDYGALTIGHHLDDPSEVEAAVDIWRNAIVEVHGTPSLLESRWRKLLWNIPFNGLAVTAGGITTDRIMADPALRAQAESLMREVVAAANADLEAHASNRRLGDSDIATMLAMTETMAAYRPSTMIDFVEGRPLEVDAIFAAPLARARTLTIDVPRLALLTAQMRALSPGR